MQKTISYCFVSFLFLCVSFLSETAKSAIYYPGPGLITASGNTTALNNDITAANASLEDDIIDLGGLTFIYDGSTTALVPNPDGAQSALPIIGSSTSGKLSIVNGSIVRSYALTPSTPFRFLYAQSGADLNLFNITLINGCSGPYSGGALYNESGATLSMQNCSLINNAIIISASGPANPLGGALYNNGTINNITNCVISGNSITTLQSTQPQGAGIYNSGTINYINNSTISENSITLGVWVANTQGLGGGIYNSMFGSINNLTNSSISYNSITALGVLVLVQGGGIFNGGSMSVISNNTIANNMLSGNNTTQGGGIAIGSAMSMSLNNNTISGNSCTTTATAIGGGIFDMLVPNPPSTVTMISNIIANNTVVGATVYAPDIYAEAESITNEGYNLLVAGGYEGGFTPASSDVIITSLSQLNLGPLQNNGGPTSTMALLAGSLALNNGNNIDSLKFDQRGYPYGRVAFGVPDIGSYEVQQ